MKTLNEFIKEKNLSKDELKKFMESIIDFSRVNGKKKDFIDFNLDNILVNDDMTLKFSFIKVKVNDFSFNFSQLMIKLLRHIDTRSEKAILLAYKLFVASSRREFNIDDIENALCEFEAKEKMEEDDDIEIEEGFRENMPCDTYGMCSGESCGNFYKCNQK